MENPETLFVSGKKVVYREEVSLEKFQDIKSKKELNVVLRNDKPYRPGSKYIYQDNVNYDCKVYVIEMVVDAPNCYIKEGEVGLLLHEINK